MREDGDDDSEEEGNARDEQTGSGAGAEYDMVALVTKKLLFSKRPMPVVKMVVASQSQT